jgi:DNA-binding response OmpR family regulator
MLSRKGFIVIAPPEAAVEVPPAGTGFHAIRGCKTAVSLTRTEGRLIDTLVAARGAWCSRQRLMESVWTDSTPTDSALSFQLFNLRAKFRDCANARNLIEASQGAVRLDPEALSFLR